MPLTKKMYANEFQEFLKERRIKESQDFFKIKLFLEKAENSLLIAQVHKDIKPNKDQAPKLYWDYWAITIAYYSMLYAAKAGILSKGYEVTDHDAAQIALGYLLVPDSIKKEDLELLDQAYKIFENEYVQYFEDAKKESHIARYSAIHMYTRRRVEEIFNNATKFVAKLSIILENKLRSG